MVAVAVTVVVGPPRLIARPKSTRPPAPARVDGHRAAARRGGLVAASYCRSHSPIVGCRGGVREGATLVVSVLFPSGASFMPCWAHFLGIKRAPFLLKKKGAGCTWVARFCREPCPSWNSRVMVASRETAEQLSSRERRRCCICLFLVWPLRVKKCSTGVYLTTLLCFSDIHVRRADEPTDRPTNQPSITILPSHGPTV